MRVLVIQLKRIGDLVLTTPLLDSLRGAFPDSGISLAIEAGSAGLLPCIPHEQAFVFRRRHADPGTWLRIARNRFDVVLDPTGNDRSAAVAAVCALARAPRRITYAKWKTKFLRPFIYTEFVESKVSHVHTADHHTALLRPLNLEKTGVPSSLEIPPEDEEFVAELLESRGISLPFVVVHPGTVKEEKFWLPARWAQIIQELQARGFTVLLTGSPSARESAHLHELFSSFPASLPQPVNLAGQLTLPQVVALIRRACFVVGVDSAPLHFADAVRTPVLGLFGPTCPHQWRPRLPYSVVVTPMGTQPAGPEYYPGRPMSELSIATVLAALEELLHSLPQADKRA